MRNDFEYPAGVTLTPAHKPMTPVYPTRHIKTYATRAEADRAIGKLESLFGIGKAFIQTGDGWFQVRTCLWTPPSQAERFKAALFHTDSNN